MMARKPLIGHFDDRFGMVNGRIQVREGNGVTCREVVRRIALLPDSVEQPNGIRLQVEGVPERCHKCGMMAIHSLAHSEPVR